MMSLLRATAPGGALTVSDAPAPAAAAAAASDSNHRAGGGKKRPGKAGAPAAAAPPVDNNIRVMPPEMLDSMLAAADGDEGKPGSSKGAAKAAKAAAAKASEVAFNKTTDAEEEDLLTRDDLKAVSVRLARKAARKSVVKGK